MWRSTGFGIALVLSNIALINIGVTRSLLTVEQIAIIVPVDHIEIRA